MNEQIKYLRIGMYGCYFLSLIEIARRVTKKQFQPIELYDQAISNGYMTVMCYMQLPNLFLQSMIGGVVSIVKATKDKLPKGDYYIGRYVKNATAHFVLVNPLANNQILYDSSGVLSEGGWELMDYRVITIQGVK